MGIGLFFASELFDGYQTVEDYISSRTTEKTHAAMRNKTATITSVLSKIAKGRH